MTTVTVAIPQCTPARTWQTRISGQLARYGTWRGAHAPRVSVSEVKGADGKPLYLRAAVAFSNESAAWGEYVLLRHGYERLGDYVNPKNRGWARRYLGLDAPGGWHESTCKGKPPKDSRIGDIADVATANPPTPWSEQPKRKAGMLERLWEMFR